MGFDMMVTANTVSIITMLTAFLNFFQIWMSDLYSWQQILLFGVVSCFSSMVFSKIVSK